MPTAAQNDLAEGLAALDSELGETFTLASAATFIGRLERNSPNQLGDMAGVIRESRLHVQRAQAAFEDGLPAVGAVITRDDETSARLARIAPGDLPGMLVFVLADEFA